MAIRLILVTIWLLLMQTACAVTDDPRQGGLAGYWYGTSSGRYEARRQQKQQQLQEEKALQRQLEAQAERYKAEVAIQNERLAREQEKTLHLENQLTLLEANLAKLQVKNDKQRQQVEGLQSQIAEARRRIQQQKSTIVELDGGGGTAPDPAKVEILRHERDRLADEYRKLNVYYQALSNALY